MNIIYPKIDIIDIRDVTLNPWLSDFKSVLHFDTLVIDNFKSKKAYDVQIIKNIMTS